MTKSVRLDDVKILPYAFPFIAWAVGESHNHRRVDTLVTVLGWHSPQWEPKNSCRCQLADGSIRIISTSLLKVDVAE